MFSATPSLLLRPVQPSSIQPTVYPLRSLNPHLPLLCSPPLAQRLLCVASCPAACPQFLRRPVPSSALALQSAKIAMFTLRVSRSILANGGLSSLRKAGVPAAVRLKREVPPSRAYADMRVNLRENNVIHSCFPDISDHFPKAYIHEFLWEGLDKWSDKVAVVCGVTGRSFTYKELRKLAGKCAASFRKNGIQPGETIGLIIPNLPQFVISILGANEAQLPAALINPMYNAEEIGAQLELSEAVAVVTLLSKYEDVKKSIEGNRKVRVPIIVINDGSGPMPSGCINFDDLVKSDMPELSTLESMSGNYEDTIIVPFSSGTTGLPKGVELTHRNIVTNQVQFGSKHVSVAEEAVGHHQEVIPLILPLFHAYGLALGFYHGLRIGAKMICIPRFSMKALTDVLRGQKPTILQVVPPMLQMMIHDSEMKPEDLKGLKVILSGAAPLGAELISIFRDRLQTDVPITQGYGMTESSPVITVSKNAPAESAGYIIPSTQLRIVGQDEHNKGQNLGVGEVGEIYAKGPQIMKGYYKNPKATAETMDGEWLKSGDLGYFTEDGCIYVQDRLKDVIKVKGYQVAPAELEELIRGFDKVQDVGVIGVEDQMSGEIPKAFVVPKPGVSLREEEVKEFVAKRLAKYKHLGHVTLTASIPKSPSGKILRKELRKVAA